MLMGRKLAYIWSFRPINLERAGKARGRCVSRRPFSRPELPRTLGPTSQSRVGPRHARQTASVDPFLLTLLATQPAVDFANSALATVRRWTSSGPSARRRVRWLA
jgi:hypothetical protein